MSRDSLTFKMVRLIQKLFISLLVICTFIVYAVHERLVNPDSAAAPASSAENSATSDQVVNSPQAIPTQPVAVFVPSPTVPARTTNSGSAPVQAVRPSPTPLPPPTAIAKSSGAFKDGAFTGSRVNAYWGYVQVKATIQNGRITAVQFLQYPSDRRTSQYINSQVMPWLQTEAIQAQSANVDLISGATLTSEAFVRSLQTALSTAQN